MAPAAVAAAIAMLLIILGVSEYMRLVITAAGIKDAMESAVVSVVNDNYNEVYHGVREGYAAGYGIYGIRGPWGYLWQDVFSAWSGRGWEQLCPL